MIIDFTNIKETVIKNFYGGELEARAKMFTDVNGKIMYGTLIPGASIGLHTHETNSEIVYVLQGKGKVLYDGVWEEVKEGTCHYCPQGHTHNFVNDGDEDLVIFSVIPEQSCQ